tara:strand:- start:440 stop:958 length:519 start_codon:yes stop_codon:yes gene_type:complete
MISNQYNFITYGDVNASLNIIKCIQLFNTSDFIINYKISNFLKGKFFIKRLIKKIFKHQLNENFRWQNDFWDSIDCSLYETNLVFNCSSNIMKNHFKDNLNKKKYNDILKYQKIINEGSLMDPPLFISSDCMNYLGGNVIKKELFILDGSRRIYAHMLNLKNPNIVLISLKK